MEKYKWYILGYVFYTSIVLASIWNERRDFWPLLIIWCITIPIALYVIWYFILKYVLTKKRGGNVPKRIDIRNSIENVEDIQKQSSDLEKSWPLVEFAKMHGKMQIGEFLNNKTGKPFKSCVFTDGGGNTTYVSFYSKLGVLTPQQIKDKRDLLKVGLLNTNKYVLYEEWDGWNDVNL